jgi:NAD+ kinase
MSTQYADEQTTRGYQQHEHQGGWGGGQSRRRREKPFFATSEFLTMIGVIVAIAIAAAVADNLEAPRAWTLITVDRPPPTSSAAACRRSAAETATSTPDATGPGAPRTAPRVSSSAMDDRFDRIGLAVHPRRELDGALATIREWAGRQGAEVVQIASVERQVAPRGEAADCDLAIALGGDGTALAALHAAAPVGRPVLGVACGSLGALTATTADRLDDALDRVAAGEWRPRRLPALTVDRDGGKTMCAINDLVLVRAGAGQVTIGIEVDGERFVRFAGDGVVSATPLGSTAYTLASGGPMIAPGATGVVITPLSPHGGVCPPLVTGAENAVRVMLDPGHGGARVEVDGQVQDVLERMEPVTFTLRLEPAYATLVSLGEEEPVFAGLRRRRILLDSPRVVARERRETPAPF